uniref:Uncharacterized protein n=1 Tax=Davidia involucrata TaxID=16924 RepID=A0A5B7B0B3_DAVIN
MEELQQRHDNWKKTPRKPRQENGHNAPNKKASVFSRLNFTSKGSVQEKKVNTKVDKSKNRITEKFQGKKKTREHEIFIGNHDDGENFSMTIHDMWSMERIEEQIPLVNLKCKGEMLKTACETERSDCIDGAVGLRLSEKQCKKRKLVRPMFRNQSSDVKTEVCDSCVNVDMPSQESSAGKENGGSCKVSTRSERIDHSEDGLSQKDIVPCMICPTICEGNSGEKGKGLIGKDSKLGEQGSAINNCLPVAVTEGLKTYQRRRCLSASPSIKDTEKEIVVDEGKMECYEAYTGTDGGGKCGEQNVDQVEVCLMKSENNIVQC